MIFIAGRDSVSFSEPTRPLETPLSRSFRSFGLVETDIASAQGWCGRPGFGGGTPWLVQTVQGQFDVDVACPPVVEHPERVFDLTPPPPAPVIARSWAGFS